jgi:uncharacterized membrane protein YbhN (UPF0104 family)
MFVLFGTPFLSATVAVLAHRTVAFWTPALLGSAAFVGLRARFTNPNPHSFGAPTSDEPS